MGGNITTVTWCEETPAQTRKRKILTYSPYFSVYIKLFNV
jgi:hypothetical protein